jgi:hypothetical protein
MEPLYIEISFQTRLGGFHIIIELMGVSNARYNGTFKSFKRLNAKRGAHVGMYQLQSTQAGHLNGEHRFSTINQPDILWYHIVSQIHVRMDQI